MPFPARLKTTSNSRNLILAGSQPMRSPSKRSHLLGLGNCTPFDHSFAFDLTTHLHLC